MIKLRIYSVIAALGLLLSASVHASFVATRSQTVDAARDMVGWSDKVNLYDADAFYFTFAVTPEVNYSRNPQKLARCLLGQSCVNQGCFETSFRVTGSQAPGRLATDWLADYFGLAPDFQSTLKLKPITWAFIFDMNTYFGLDCFYPGLFLKLHAPVVIMSNRIQLAETIIDQGELGYPAGYFAPIAVPREDLLDSFKNYAGDSLAPSLDPNTGVWYQPLTFAKFPVPCTERLEETNLSDLEAILGLNFLLEEDYHLGVGILTRAPTGSTVKGNFLFEPIIGNQHHWELGAFLTGGYTFWTDCECDRSLTLSAEAFITHMFTNTQCRTFDLKNNGCSSKYMLAQQITSQVSEFLYASNNDVPSGPTDETTQATAQFANIYTPVANLTHVPVRVSVGVQADVAFMLTYIRDRLSFDFGYDFWAKSRENICLAKPTPLSTGTWALKGDAYTYGFGASDAVIGADENIPLSVSQSLATIHAGTNTPIGTAYNDNPTSDVNQKRNPGVDNATFGVTSDVIANDTDRIVYEPGLTATDLNQQRISNPLVILSDADIDLASQEIALHSNKFFAHVAYNWPMREICSAYVGFGGFIESAHSSYKKGCANKTKSCCAVSQWGIWLKSGISF